MCGVPHGYVHERPGSDVEHDRRDAVVSEEKKRTTQIAPRLYDLTTLQREANNRYGFSADRTLRIAQALYERHKVITYPRTDSRALPEDYMPNCREVMRKLDEIQDLAHDMATLHRNLATHAAERELAQVELRARNDRLVADVEDVLDGLAPSVALAEPRGVRAEDGSTAFYPLVENHHEDGILRVSYAPAPDAGPRWRVR